MFRHDFFSCRVVVWICSLWYVDWNNSTKCYGQVGFLKEWVFSPHQKQTAVKKLIFKFMYMYCILFFFTHIYFMYQPDCQCGFYFKLCLKHVVKFIYVIQEVFSFCFYLKELFLALLFYVMQEGLVFYSCHDILFTYRVTKVSNGYMSNKIFKKI